MGTVELVLLAIWLVSVFGLFIQWRTKRMSFKAKWEARGYIVKGSSKNVVIYKIKKR